MAGIKRRKMKKRKSGGTIANSPAWHFHESLNEIPRDSRSVGMLLKLITPLLLLSVPLQAVPVFIGTGSTGIYQADFDPATGKLTEPVLAAEYKNPGFLAQHPSKPIVYSIGQPKVALADGFHSVAAFNIGEDLKLEFLGEASAGGKGACHLEVDATGSTLAVANYGDGRISTVRLNDKGIPGELVSVISNTGTGPSQPRQNGPHAHGVYFDKANKHLFVPDLGLDQVLIYPFDAATSKLGEPLPPLATAPGAGPRHMAFSPDEKHAYVINELDNTVLAASHQAGTGKLTPLATVPTLPADFKEKNTTAEVEVHPNGKFVYASNRGHHSIAVYQRDPASGALTFLQHAPCGGKTPRHFKIDPSGKWLLCGHQDSNTISVLSLDPDTGLLGEASGTVTAPNPICMLFSR
jgi:6-phosphogluconolactonase